MQNKISQKKIATTKKIANNKKGAKKGKTLHTRQKVGLENEIKMKLEKLQKRPTSSTTQNALEIEQPAENSTWQSLQSGNGAKTRRKFDDWQKAPSAAHNILNNKGLLTLLPKLTMNWSKCLIAAINDAQLGTGLQNRQMCFGRRWPKRMEANWKEAK
jgi:hypothetical protein